MVAEHLRVIAAILGPAMVIMVLGGRLILGLFGLRTRQPDTHC